MNTAKTLLLVCATVWCSQSVSSAAVIYSQAMPEEPGAAFSSVDIPTIGQKVADNFVLDSGQPRTIRSIRFIGGYSLRNPPPLDPPLDALPDDNFRIVFLGDNAGNPGLPLANGDFMNVSPISRVPTNGQLLNGITSPVEFIIDLGEGVTLNANTEYWVSITNNPGPDHGWSWARASGAFDQNTASTFAAISSGPWNVFGNGGMFFELANHNVPEPSSLNLLALLAVFAIALNIRQPSKLAC